MNYFRSQFIQDLHIEAPIAYGGARSLPPDRQQLFIELGLLVDLAMDVADKVAFEPILVNPAAELAGDPLYAFKGFFDINIRRHDFAQGMADAFSVWQDVASAEPAQTLILPSGEAIKRSLRSRTNTGAPISLSASCWARVRRSSAEL